jgi:hypothetical protein
LNECAVAVRPDGKLDQGFSRVSATAIPETAMIWNRLSIQPDTKNPPERASGGSLLKSALSNYAFDIPAFTASAVIGSERTRAPEALKIALASAGAITVTAGSPTPVAFSPLAMTLMATSGT